MTLDSDAFDSEADELDDEVAGPGNRIVGARAKKVTEFLARQLVDDPDGIDVEVVEGRPHEAKLVVRATPGDVGRLIGRRGRTVQALRQVARAAGAADDERVQLDVVD
ncbi:MAG TPA: KH domain-containing protein [Acidimicrobiia bacterium]